MFLPDPDFPVSAPPVARAQYCAARCGGGKTHAALTAMATHPARYIYAVDRRDQALTRAALITAMAREAGLREPFVEIVMSDASNQRASKPMVELVAEAIERSERLSHAIVIITQATLKRTTMQTYRRAKWHLIVDETPDLLEIISRDDGEHMIPFLSAHYELRDDGRIDVLRPIPAREFDRPALAPFRQMHDLIKAGGAYASITDWSEAARPWWITRCWSVEVLSIFDSVTFYADSFDETITYHFLRDQGVEFEEIFLPDDRIWRDRVVTINYYIDSAEASRTLFERPDFKAELGKIAAHMSSLKINNHLWTTNSSIAPIFDADKIGGAKVTPKQAGSNDWIEWQDATMIYAARASPDEILILGRMGMSEADLVKARAGYDIKQFVMRLSLRDPSSTAPVTVRVFDRAQALALKQYLDETYGFQCDVEKIDVGVIVPERKRGPRTPLTEEEKRERKRLSNAKRSKKRMDKAAERGS